MKIIVTGAAGFVGSNNVLALNARGERDVIAVDNLKRSEKFANLVDAEFGDTSTSRSFRSPATSCRAETGRHLPPGRLLRRRRTDGRYMMENNYRYSVELFRWCQELRVPFVYASSGSVLRPRSGIQGGRARRAPVERLRLLQVPVRPVHPPGAARPDARPWSACATSTSTDRASRTRAGWPRWRSTTSSSSWPTVPSSCSKAATGTPAATSGATSSTSTMSSRPTCTSGITRSPASTTSVRDAHRRSTTSRRRSSMRFELTRASPCCRSSSSLPPADQVRPLPGRAAWQVSGVHAGGPLALEQAGMTAPFRTVEVGTAEYVRWLLAPGR